MLFPKVTLKDYLKQSADDIISILTHPTSTIFPSLEAGDPVRDALLELLTHLKRIDKLPETNSLQQQDGGSPTRVHNIKDVSPMPPHAEPHIMPDGPYDTPSPRVQFNLTQDDVTVAKLTNHSDLPKNIRYCNSPTHSYKLCSNPNIIAQHIFNYDHNINHIYAPPGKKETIDSLLKGANSST